MRARCRLTLACLLAVALLGGGNGLLQVVAWTSMLIARCPTQGVTAAVASTFDGDHPCVLCRALAQARVQAHQLHHPDASAAVVSALRVLAHPWTSPDLELPAEASAPGAAVAMPAPAAWIAGEAQAPPRPPPRSC